MDTKRIQNETSAKIAKLNDAFRQKTCYSIAREVYGIEDLEGLIRAVRDFNDFNEDNDPYGEHDFGALDWNAERVFWKIDYYNPAFNGWCAPLSPGCEQVLTVYLAEGH